MSTEKLTEKLTDVSFIPQDATGKWRVRTEHSVYLLDFDEMTLKRQRVAQGAAVLPLDEKQELHALRAYAVDIGFSAQFFLGDGLSGIMRVSTPVTAIEQL